MSLSPSMERLNCVLCLGEPRILNLERSFWTGFPLTEKRTETLPVGEPKIRKNCLNLPEGWPLTGKISERDWNGYPSTRVLKERGNRGDPNTSIIILKGLRSLGMNLWMISLIFFMILRQRLKPRQMSVWFEPIPLVIMFRFILPYSLISFSLTIVSSAK